MQLKQIELLTLDQQVQFVVQGFYAQYLNAKQSANYLDLAKELLRKQDTENAILYLELVTNDYLPAKFEALQLLAETTYKTTYDTEQQWGQVGTKKMKIEQGEDTTLCIRSYAAVSSHYCEAIKLIRDHYNLAKTIDAPTHIILKITHLLKIVLGVDDIQECEVQSVIFNINSQDLVKKITRSKQPILLAPLLIKIFGDLFEALGLKGIIHAPIRSYQQLPNQSEINIFSLLPKPKLENTAEPTTFKSNKQTPNHN